MDLIKIGSFLSKLRAEHGLTQSQLGDEIGVTNKTISRWETGNYLPPVEMLELLSEKYSVSINEILAGQRLSDTDFRQNAEENIKVCLEQSSFTLKERMEYYEKKWKKDHLFQTIFAAIILAAVFVLGAMYTEVLCGVSCIAAMIYNVVRYNCMRAYVERKAFEAVGKEDRE